MSTPEARLMTAWTCPHCGATSHNPNDVTNRYCGRCHHFCDDVLPPWECPHCMGMNDEDGRERQYCGACGRDREDVPPETIGELHDRLPPGVPTRVDGLTWTRWDPPQPGGPL